MNISAICNQWVDFKGKENQHKVVTMPFKSDEFENSVQKHKKDILFHNALELAQEIGIENADLERLIDIAEKMNNGAPIGITLLNMMCAQKEFEFDNINQLLTFSILEHCQSLHDNQIVPFARNEEYAETFMKIMNTSVLIDDKKPFDTITPVEVYELINKSDDNKHKKDKRINTGKKSKKHATQSHQNLFSKIYSFLNTDNNNRSTHNKPFEARI